MKIREIMSSELVWLNIDNTIAEAAEIMDEFSVRHLPVLEGDQLVGVVSSSDILLYSDVVKNRLVKKTKKVGQVMNVDIVTCSPENSISDVAATLIACKISCVPVLKDNRLVGIVTATDLLDSICVRDEMDGLTVMPLDFRDLDTSDKYVSANW